MLKKLPLLAAFAAILLCSPTLLSQAQATAGLPSESAYTNLEASGGATGFGIEAPDAGGDSNCTDDTRTGDHSDFGEHITHVAETELPGNSSVFLFHSHIAEDSDRCRNIGSIDRIRTEIKGGPAGNTDPELEHEYGNTTHYRWQFRLDAGFVGTSSFTHLFQLKAAGGDDDGLPILTITARANDVELIHTGDSDNAPQFNNGAVDKIVEPSLTPFLGRWVEVYVRAVHANADDGGELTVRINDVLTGNSIVNISETNIDLWRGAENSTDYINRPKWGIYRKLVSGVGQRDETVRFANFCSSENGDVCPSLLPEAPAVTAPTNLLPLDEAKNVPLSMPLLWDPVAGATSYDVFFGTNPNPPFLVNTANTDFPVVMALGQTYYYQIVATDGTDTGPSPVMSFSTLSQADGNGWDVFRGHAKPELENSDDFEDNSTVEADTEEISNVPLEDGNTQFTYFRAEAGNYRSRYRYPANNTSSTLVLRMSRLNASNPSMIFAEYRNGGFGQKVRVRDDNIRLERVDGVPAGTVTAKDFPADFFEDGEMHVLRITFEEIAGFAMSMLETKVYLDEDPTPFFSLATTTVRTGNYIEIGKSGGSDYGANIDFYTLNPEGAFPPGTAGRDLPADLLENTALPLRWANQLTVSNRAKDRLLKWAVAQQVDVDYFTVERSSDGRAFSPLNRIAGDGTLADLREIAYVDNNQFNVGAYYRIRQTDYDGSFSFSNTVYAGPIINPASPAVSPNPATDRLTVTNLPEGITAYTLLDITGREFGSGQVRPGADGINLSTLKPGVYLLRLRRAEGQLMPSQRFVKR